jgi:hypothetical protein
MTDTTSNKAKEADTSKYDVRNIKGMSKLKDVIAYAYSHRPSLIIFTIALLGMILLLSCCGWDLLINEIVKLWRDSPLGFAIQVITLAAVISMWVFELLRDWRASLPKYLSVEFRHHDKLRICCMYAPLVGEGDARQMAQSLGKQVNNGGYLPIAPTFDQIELVEQRDWNGRINGGKPFLHYMTSIRLIENITKLNTGNKKQQSAQQPDNNEQTHEKSDKKPLKEIPEDHFVLWSWPFDPVTEDCLIPCTQDRKLQR